MTSGDLVVLEGDLEDPSFLPSPTSCDPGVPCTLRTANSSAWQASRATRLRSEFDPPRTETRSPAFVRRGSRFFVERADACRGAFWKASRIGGT